MNKFEKEPGSYYFLVENTKISKFVLIGPNPLKPFSFYLAEVDNPKNVELVTDSKPNRVWVEDYEEAKDAVLAQAAERWAEIQEIYFKG